MIPPLSGVGRRLLFAVASMACQTILLLVVLSTDDSWAGKVIMRVTPNHGLHVGDLPVLLIWALGMAATVAGVPDSWRHELPTAPPDQREALRTRTEVTAEPPVVHD